MRPRLGHVLVLGALVFALSGGAAAQQYASPIDSDARIVRLSYVDGSVQMDRDDAAGSGTAFQNSPVVGGSRLTTGSDGFAEVEFETGGTLRVTPNSDVRFRELGLRDGHKVSLVEVAQGTAYFNVRKDSDDDFRVLVAGQELRVPKSSRFRVHLQPESAQIAVMKGELHLVGPDNNVKIKKDEQLLLDFQDPGRYFLGRQVDALEYDTWDQERDDYRDHYANASNAYSGYSSNYQYGVSDLNYYGTYMDVPGWGYMWRPYGYDVSWDPFMDGAWVWYPGWGYMWVSSYPWGWMPYRYGRWIWVPGYGWMWQPGNEWHHWYACNAVYNPPSNYHPPQPPNGGGGGGGGGHRPPPVVIVGKAPFGEDRRRLLNPDGGDTRRLPLRAGVTEGAVHAPPVVTPGVQPVRALDELRRLHGQDLGVTGGQRPVMAIGTQTTTGASTGTTGKGAMTKGGTGMQQPSHPITVAPVQQRGRPETVAPVQTVHPEPRLQQTPTQQAPVQQQHVTPPPAQRQSTPPPPPTNPQSSYRSNSIPSNSYTSSGSSTGAGGSSYHPSSNPGGSSQRSSGGGASGSSGGSHSSSGGSHSAGSSSHDSPK